MELMELEWPLIIFTFFMCLAGGIFGMQGFLILRGKGAKMQIPSLIVSFIAFVIGGIGVFTHLQHWERMFNGFGHITSPITHEVIGVAVFFVIMVVYFLFMRRDKDGVAPKWAAVLAIIVGVGLPILAGRSYSMAADPVWNTPIMLIFYLCDTVMMGALVILIIAKATKCEEVTSDGIFVFFIAAACRFVVILIYALYIWLLGDTYSEVGYYFDPAMPDTPMKNSMAYAHSLYAGDLSGIFYGLVIVLGSLIPLAIGLFMLLRNNERFKKMLATPRAAITWVSIALLCTVVGGVLWRCIQYWVCIKIFPFFTA